MKTKLLLIKPIIIILEAITKIKLRVLTLLFKTYLNNSNVFN